MQTTAVRLYTWGYAETKTYLAALLFVLGNIVLPQLFHLVPQGGMTWLPIYFFTLVGAYKYGWRVGLLTAIFSPLVNSVLFGMPPVGALPAILLKSVLMAVIGGYVAARFNKATILLLMVVVSSFLVGILVLLNIVRIYTIIYKMKLVNSFFKFFHNTYLLYHIIP